MNHPTPWQVRYYSQFSWHEKSQPSIVDANGEIVVDMPQNVRHPGLYDELADKTAHQIVNAVNIGGQNEVLLTCLICGFAGQ